MRLNPTMCIHVLLPQKTRADPACLEQHQTQGKIPSVELCGFQTGGSQR